ncbi:MAG: DnaD domain protein [Bacilli bacterium]
MIHGFKAIDFNFLLLDYYKKFNITENELTVILMIDHLLNTDNSLITNELLSLKMNYSVDEIDGIFVSLMKKGFVEYIEGEKNELRTSIEPLKNRLYHEFEITVMAKETINIDNEYQKRISELYHEFESAFNRTLCPLEISRIDEWLHAGYEMEKIKYALKAAILKNKKTIKAVDSILIKNTHINDVIDEGYSLRGKNATEDAETREKIEILKTKWDDEK